LATDAGQHPFHEADAGAGATSQGAAGKIQRRSAKTQPETVGTLAQTQGKPRRRLFADVTANASVHWLLHNDPKRYRTARRAFSLGERFDEVRHSLCNPWTGFYPIFRDPWCWPSLQSVALDHGRNDALAITPDPPISRRRSSPGQNHALHAADVYGFPL